MKVLVVFGTRPEAIKMAPVICALKNRDQIEVRVCTTGQHRQMLDQVLDFFSIKPDYDLKLMREKQGLTELTCAIIADLKKIFDAEKPDIILLHGDTTTTLAGSLAAFYARVPVGHVEAGLRSHKPLEPWPEEMNRRVTDAIAALFFAPTQTARANLLAENVPPETVHVVGNTVIDALVTTLDLIDRDAALTRNLEDRFRFLDPNKKLIVVTGHRRESFGRGFREVCHAIAEIAATHPVQIVYPVHLNPNVQEPVYRILGNISNVHLLEPLDYVPFVYLMRMSYMVLTDSGGIQEEAPSLGKPVLVMRNVTERPEAVAAGTTKLVGTDRASITSSVSEILTNGTLFESMSKANNPYGNGKSSEQIAQVLLEWRQSCHKDNVILAPA